MKNQIKAYERIQDSNYSDRVTKEWRLRGEAEVIGVCYYQRQVASAPFVVARLDGQVVLLSSRCGDDPATDGMEIAHGAGVEGFGGWDDERAVAAAKAAKGKETRRREWKMRTMSRAELLGNGFRAGQQIVECAK